MERIDEIYKDTKHKVDVLENVIGVDCFQIETREAKALLGEIDRLTAELTAQKRRADAAEIENKALWGVLNDNLDHTLAGMMNEDYGNKSAWKAEIIDQVKLHIAAIKISESLRRGPCAENGGSDD